MTNAKLVRFRRYNLVDLVAGSMRDRMLVACNLCAYDGTFTLLAQVTSDDTLTSVVGEHALAATVMCPRCGWTFKPGRLTKAQLANLYARMGGAATVNAAVIDTIDERSENVRVYIESAAGRSLDSAAVLDVGGGGGQVSIAFARTKCQVDLLELGGIAPIHESMNPIKAAFDDFETSARYDLIILSHVLEHTWDPLQWLKKARDLLSSSGLLFVEVPFEFYTPYLKGKLGDPCHVGYFCPRTLTSFLKGAGLAIVALDRTLAQYDVRRVMAIRAVAIPATDDLISRESRMVRAALIQNILEMIHPRQLMLAFSRQ